MRSGGLFAPIERAQNALAIGRVIRSHRKAIGLTQEEFAELVNLSKNYIGNIERGEYEVSVSVLARIGQALDTNASALLRDAGL